VASRLTSRDYEARLKELNMIRLEERRHQMDMAQVQKLLTGRDRVDVNRLLTMANSHDRDTPAAADDLCLRQGNGRLEVRRNFFTQRIVSPWNQVPSEIKLCPGLQESLQKTEERMGPRSMREPTGDTQLRRHRQ